MANVYPFCPYRYTAKAGPLERVATEPYDTIPPALEAAYRASGPHNLVHLILPRGDYAAAASRLDSWIAGGILAQDPTPAIYIYEQRFRLPETAEPLIRRAFIGLGDLEPYGSVVHRHERTLDAPVADRLELLRHTRAQFGSIFMMYPDPERAVDNLLEAAISAAPAAAYTDHAGTGHTLWRVDEPAWIAAVQAAMRGRPLVIVDGHHRYEAALRYARHPRVMMTFVNACSPGLRTLAAHRVISGLPNFIPAPLTAIATRVDALNWSATCPGRVRFGMALRGSLWHIDLDREDGALNLDILHDRILGAILGITPDAIARREYVAPCRGVDAAIAQVERGDAQVAFLVEPLAVGDVARLALSGATLPQKSTDFYPKLASGLTIYRFA